jgi:hypothetical protein
VFENRVLRKITRPKRAEVTADWNECQKKPFMIRTPPPNIMLIIKSKRMKWAGHAACIVVKRNAYRVLGVKPEGKRPLGIPTRRRDDNIKTT